MKRIASASALLLALAVGVRWWLEAATMEPLAAPSSEPVQRSAGVDWPPQPPLRRSVRTPVAAASPTVPSLGPATVHHEIPAQAGASAGSPAPPSSPEGEAQDFDAGRLYAITALGLREAMHDLRWELRQCWDAWLEQNPDLQGSLDVGFTIERTDAGVGEVRSVTVLDGGLGNPFLEGCVLNALSGLRFDAPDEPITIDYPFHFIQKR